MELRPPFDTFQLEQRAGEHKDFGLPEDSDYPLRGVTYPVNYGYIPNFVSEDGHELDVFVGSGELAGYILVKRPDGPPEHKIYINVTEDEENDILDAFKPVLIDHGRYETRESLLQAIEPFRQKS